MIKRFLVYTVAGAILTTGIALAYDGGPPASRTGAPAIGGKPAEGLCFDCHSTETVNTGGMVELLNAPSHFQPGQTYTMTVRITSDQTSSQSGRVWGFELTAVSMTDGTGAGTFLNVSGQGTMIDSGSGNFSTRRYIEVLDNNHASEASPVEWQVQWTAPAAGTGTVGFYFAGVAANGSAGNNGDWVYNGSYLTKDVTPTLPTSWGSVKTRYR